MIHTVAHSPLYTFDEYFGLVEAGRLDADSRVELLEGVIVAMSPHSPGHADGIRRMDAALRTAFPDHVVSVQLTFRAGARSGPEPDLAVLPGDIDDYRDSHPTEALLIVEVADTSLAQDRLSKSRIYAGAGVPEYWILNLVDGVLEVHRDPDVEACLYRKAEILERGDSVVPVHSRSAGVRVDDLFPR